VNTTPDKCHQPGNTKGGSITVPLTSCLTVLESAVWQLTILFLLFSQTSQTGGQQYSDTSPFSLLSDTNLGVKYAIFIVQVETVFFCFQEY
jgi:hypothetical protein